MTQLPYEEDIVQERHVVSQQRALSDLVYRNPGWRRWLHGVPELSFGYLAHAFFRDKIWRDRIVRLIWSRFAEYWVACYRDLKIALQGREPPILFTEPGLTSRPGRKSVALYVHFSPSGAISQMVLRQIEIYNRLGFQVVFISNAPTIHAASWRAVRQRAALVVHRRNFAYDFGAWKDVLPLALQRWPQMEELLLVNDSSLGPIRPLDPAFETMRAAGDGVFGMQESLQGGTHLQSWFILARGKPVIADMVTFFETMKLSTSKWNIIQRGELSLTRQMLKRGHRVQALHPYWTLVDAALADPDQRADLIAMLSRHFARGKWANAQSTLKRVMLSRPLNPTHHLWRVLVKSPYCAFIKTELILKNPGNVPHVGELWRNFVPEDAPCDLVMLEDHLDIYGKHRHGQ